MQFELTAAALEAVARAADQTAAANVAEDRLRPIEHHLPEIVRAVERQQTASDVRWLLVEDVAGAGRRGGRSRRVRQCGRGVIERFSVAAAGAVAAGVAAQASLEPELCGERKREVKWDAIIRQVRQSACQLSRPVHRFDKVLRIVPAATTRRIDEEATHVELRVTHRRFHTGHGILPEVRPARSLLQIKSQTNAFKIDIYLLILYSYAALCVPVLQYTYCTV